MAEQMSGYPSIDKPWLKYYEDGASDAYKSVPEKKTIWDVYCEQFMNDPDIPAIEYFGRSILRKDFVTLVEEWARFFRYSNVQIGEVVPVFSVVFPDITAILFALNAVGAIPYFVKLDISCEEIDHETKDSRIAIVYGGMWKQVESVFSKPRFEKVIIINAADHMPLMMKLFAILSSKAKKEDFSGTWNEKFISAQKARKLGNHFSGDYHVPFASNRIALITSSSGTSAAGVKGIMDTNESILSSIYMGNAAGIRYYRNKKVLIELPFVASTSINCLFLLPLFRGMICILEPRLSEDRWFDDVMKHKPATTLTTGAYWETFFRRAELEIEKGKRLDFSFADAFVMGGSGTTPSKLTKMNDLLMNNKAVAGIFCGYGLSEIFGVLSVDIIDAKRDNPLKNCSTISVGVPFPGYVIGVFDEAGKELKYGERGELWVSSPTIMHGYYGKPELTAKTLIDGWLHTGDLCAIDADGYVYCYGRLANSIILGDKRVYLFDIANEVREKFNLCDCMVEKKELDDGSMSLVMYLVQNSGCRIESKKLYTTIDKYLMPNLRIDGYKEYSNSLPNNPTTLKPRTHDLDGFVKYNGDQKLSISYKKKDNNTYTLQNKVSRGQFS